MHQCLKCKEETETYLCDACRNEILSLGVKLQEVPKVEVPIPIEKPCILVEHEPKMKTQAEWLSVSTNSFYASTRVRKLPLPSTPTYETFAPRSGKDCFGVDYNLAHSTSYEEQRKKQLRFSERFKR